MQPIHTGTRTAEDGPGNTRDFSPAPDLTVVIPAHNEELSIRALVEEWIGQLQRLEISYQLRVYDDGSRDRTGVLLGEMSSREPALVLVQQENRGHGPTVLRGYREAPGSWIAQVDADGEVAATEFEKLWRKRDEFDLLLGYRVGRRTPPARRILSAFSRWSVYLLFGQKLKDVNVPFRLIRSSALMPLIESLPDNTLTPNIILAGLSGRYGLRVAEFPVVHRGRKAGQTTLVGLSVWKFAFRALLQAWRASGSRP